MIARAYRVYKPLMIAKLLALSPAPAPVQFSVGEYLYLRTYSYTCIVSDQGPWWMVYSTSMHAALNFL